MVELVMVTLVMVRHSNHGQRCIFRPFESLRVTQDDIKKQPLLEGLGLYHDHNSLKQGS